MSTQEYVRRKELIEKDEYKCIRCGEVWGFVPADYDFMAWKYPNVCPLCSMPITEMIKEVYPKDGLREILRMIWIRITK